MHPCTYLTATQGVTNTPGLQQFNHRLAGICTLYRPSPGASTPSSCIMPHVGCRSSTDNFSKLIWGCMCRMVCPGGVIASYLHSSPVPGLGRIGCLVALSTPSGPITEPNVERLQVGCLLAGPPPLPPPNTVFSLCQEFPGHLPSAHACSRL